MAEVNSIHHKTLLAPAFLPESYQKPDDKPRATTEIFDSLADMTGPKVITFTAQKRDDGLAKVRLFISYLEGVKPRDLDFKKKVREAKAYEKEVIDLLKNDSNNKLVNEFQSRVKLLIIKMILDVTFVKALDLFGTELLKATLKDSSLIDKYNQALFNNVSEKAALEEENNKPNPNDQENKLKIETLELEILANEAKYKGSLKRLEKDSLLAKNKFFKDTKENPYAEHIFYSTESVDESITQINEIYTSLINEQHERNKFYLNKLKFYRLSFKDNETRSLVIGKLKRENRGNREIQKRELTAFFLSKKCIENAIALKRAYITPLDERKEKLKKEHLIISEELKFQLKNVSCSTDKESRNLKLKFEAKMKEINAKLQSSVRAINHEFEAKYIELQL